MANTTPPLLYEGPNADLVNEVIAFAFGDVVFASTTSREPSHPVEIITDMRQAVDAAGGVGSLAFFRADYTAMQRLMNRQDLAGDELGLCWQDLLSNLTAAYIKTTEWYEWEKAHAAGVHCIESMAVQWTKDTPVALVEHLRSRLPEGPRGPDRRRGYYREYICEQAAADLSHCAMNRAFNGLTDNFWERLFQVYQAGFWPCGWQGQWPSPGRLLAWRPPADVLQAGRG